MRHYKAKKRPFDPDHEQKMNDAIKDVKEKGLTYRKAAEKHGLSKSSVERQYKRRKIVGRPSALSEVE